MRSVHATAFAVVSSFALFASNAQASSSCWYPNEAKAAQLRDFHALLMVGTLQCRSSNKLAVERYNSFVNAQRGFLDANSRILKAHFLREQGSYHAQSAYDKFSTSLANLHSQNATDEGFCAMVDTYARMGTDASEADLSVLAESLSQKPESGACPPSNYVTSEGNQPAEAAVTAEVVAPGALDTATPVEASAMTVTPILAPEPPSGLKQVSAPATAPAPASREDALQAAVAALQAATAALQAASAPAATTIEEPPAP